MRITLELNGRFKTGYQIHTTSSIEDGDPVDFDDTYDVKPYPLWKARMMAVKSLELYNERFGTDYQLQDVLATTMEGVRVNSRVDLDSARTFKAVREALENESIHEEDTYAGDLYEEAKAEAIEYLTMTFAEWNETLGKDAEYELKRFCEYISMHGTSGKAQKLFYDLTGMPVEEGCNWIEEKVNEVLEKTHSVDTMMSFVIKQ